MCRNKMEAPSTKHEFRYPEPAYCKLTHKISFLLGAKLDHTRAVLKAFLSCQKQHEKLLSESRLLRVMIYKRNGQLRREKSLQLLKRVQACLKRVDNFGKVFTLVNDIHTDLQRIVPEIKSKTDCKLPCQQTWSYLLYLQQQYVELLKATAAYCVAAFEHLSCYLVTGMLIPQMLMFMAVAARVWVLSHTMVGNLQTSYNQLYPVREHIQRTQSDWRDPELPSELYTDISGEVDPGLANKLSDASKQTIRIIGQDINSISTQDHLGDNKVQNIGERRIESSGMFSLYVEDEEDLGVPVAIKRKAETLADENSNPKKKRKKKRNKNNDEVSDEATPSFEDKAFPQPNVCTSKYSKQKAKSKLINDWGSYVTKVKDKKKLKKVNKKLKEVITTTDSTQENSSEKRPKVKVKKKNIKVQLNTVTNFEVENSNQSGTERALSNALKEEQVFSFVEGVSGKKEKSAVKKLKQKNKKLKAKLQAEATHGEAVLDVKPGHQKKSSKKQKVSGDLGEESNQQAGQQKKKKKTKENCTGQILKVKKKKNKAEQTIGANQEYTNQSSIKKASSSSNNNMSKREPAISFGEGVKKLKERNKKLKAEFGEVAVIDRKPGHQKQNFKKHKIQGVLGRKSKPQVAGQKKKKFTSKS